MLTRILLIIFTLALTTFAQTPAGPPIEPGVSHALAIWRAANYTDVRYKLNLRLEKMSPVLKGTMEIRLKVEEKRSGGVEETGTQAPSPANAGSSGVGVPQIILDWRKIRGSESLSTITNVSLNGETTVVSPGFSRPQSDLGPPKGGTPNAYEERDEHLIFSDGVVPGENVIKLDFTSPILTSGSAITRYIDKEDGSEYIYSLFVPSDASTAFPVFDQPDLKARYQLNVIAPKDWILATNTPFEKWTEESISALKNPKILDESNHFIAEETKPISTYVFAFAVGPFRLFDEDLQNKISITDVSGIRTTKWVSRNGLIYVRKSQAGKFKPHAAEVFRLNREGIKYLESYFDYKFPFPKYDIVLIPEFPFGGMEHAGATFLREASVIFPQEPTKNDYISRANVIFHEAAHQWFGDTVTMKWFDDLWLKEGFAEFMAYKTLEKVMPEYNAWKVFYERNKQAAYLTDSTKGTTPIYQEIANLSAAKSAYGNIVYRKAPSFLRQAEFYLGPDKFQTAVRAFLKKHEYANAGWEDLVKEFEAASGQDVKDFAQDWVKQRGMPKLVYGGMPNRQGTSQGILFVQKDTLENGDFWTQKFNLFLKYKDGTTKVQNQVVEFGDGKLEFAKLGNENQPIFIFPNYQDYGYGIFLLDDKSRDYVLKNIQNEKDDFLRTMMWGSLWDSVREAELDPKDYVELVIKVLSSNFSWPDAAKKPAKAGTQNVETDESTIATLLNRVSTAMRYYLPTDAERVSSPHVSKGSTRSATNIEPSLTVGLQTRLEALLIDRMQRAPTPGLRITYYRAFLGLASSDNARNALKQILAGPLKGNPKITATAPLANDGLPTLRTKDKFDIVTRLMVLGDADAPKLLAQLEKTETSDEARRYTYAARAGMATPENKAKYWSDFTTNKDISESWIEAAFVPFNATSHADLTLPYLERALAELPNLKRSRKIFFVNGWLGAFIGGQRSEAALAIINKFLADNPNLDKDLRLKILENSDLIERAVKIRGKFKID